MKETLTKRERDKQADWLTDTETDRDRTNRTSRLCLLGSHEQGTHGCRVGEQIPEKVGQGLGTLQR